MLSSCKHIADKERPQVKVLEASEAYRLWAPTYSDETAISFLEDRLVRSMTPSLEDKRLLDAGCGTGRRIRNAGAAFAVGLEPCREMLAAGVATEGPLSGVDLVVGDVREMPLQASGFAVVWCRLVLGHLPTIGEAYAELARVADFGATVIVSDFHPEAVDAGHRRSFRLADVVIEIEHHVHRIGDHIEAASAAGLAVEQMRDAVIGNDVRPFYENAGRSGSYGEHLGLPVVHAIAFRKVR